jgi:hypothetical protein
MGAGLARFLLVQAAGGVPASAVCDLGTDEDNVVVLDRDTGRRVRLATMTLQFPSEHSVHVCIGIGEDAVVTVNVSMERVHLLLDRVVTEPWTIVKYHMINPERPCCSGSTPLLLGQTMTCPFKTHDDDVCMTAHVREIPSGRAQVVWMLRVPSRNQTLDMYSASGDNLWSALWARFRCAGVVHQQPFRGKWAMVLRDTAVQALGATRTASLPGTFDMLHLNEVCETPGPDPMSEDTYQSALFGEYPPPWDPVAPGSDAIPPCVLPIAVVDEAKMVNVTVFVVSRDTATFTTGAVLDACKAMAGSPVDPFRHVQWALREGGSGHRVQWRERNKVRIVAEDRHYAVALGIVRLLRGASCKGAEGVQELKAALAVKDAAGQGVMLDRYSSYLMYEATQQNWAAGLAALLEAGTPGQPKTYIAANVNDSIAVARLAGAGCWEALRVLLRWRNLQGRGVDPSAWARRGHHFEMGIRISDTQRQAVRSELLRALPGPRTPLSKRLPAAV